MIEQTFNVGGRIVTVPIWGKNEREMPAKTKGEEWGRIFKPTPDGTFEAASRMGGFLNLNSRHVNMIPTPPQTGTYWRRTLWRQIITASERFTKPTLNLFDFRGAVFDTTVVRGFLTYEKDEG